MSATISCTDSASLDLSTGMTLEAWVRPTISNNNRAIIVKERTTGGFAYSLFSSDDNERPFGGIRGTTERRAIGPSDVPINVWTHLAATYDGSVLRLYVNGVQVSSISGAGPIINTLGALRLGFNSLDSSTYRGLMDDVRIYNRALSAQEIASDMNTPVK